MGPRDAYQPLAWSGVEGPGPRPAAVDYSGDHLAKAQEMLSCGSVRGRVGNLVLVADTLAGHSAERDVCWPCLPNAPWGAVRRATADRVGGVVDGGAPC